jgi:hypothetical protein
LGLELLTQADYVLNACGRAVPPKGYRFVDLPRIIPYHQTVTAALATWQWEDENKNGILISFKQPTPIYTIITNIGPPLAPNGCGVQISIVGNTITINVQTGPSTITIGEGIALLNANPAFSVLATASALPGTNLALVWGAGDLFGENSSGGFSQPFPSQSRLENTSNTMFVVKGIMLSTDPVQFRLKWPNGRYWNQFPSNNPLVGFGADFPQGTGGNLYALDEEVYIEAGGRAAIELSGPNAAPVDVALWGCLRYLLKETGMGGAVVDNETCIIGYPDKAKNGQPNCLVGYPVSAGAKGKTGLITIPDPIQVLKERTRFPCWPNGNIMAPEFLLGNQCETDTPPGFTDEAFTFLSQAVSITAGGANQSYSNSIDVPGQDDVYIRRWRIISTWSEGAAGLPIVGLRSPTAYSVTGGDQIPLWLMYWVPMFPTLRMKAGTDLIFDVSVPGLVNTITVQLEFDAVKRRRIQ